MDHFGNSEISSEDRIRKKISELCYVGCGDSAYFDAVEYMLSFITYFCFFFCAFG